MYSMLMMGFAAYVFVRVLFWILHRAHNMKPIPESGSSHETTPVETAPTHAKILEKMNPEIKAYFDPKHHEYLEEYRRVMSIHMPQDVKDAKKRRAQERVVAEEKKKLQHLDWFGLTPQHIFESKINKSGNRHEVYERLHQSFFVSSTKHLKWKKDLSYDYQPLDQIRKGFVSRFNSTGESDAIVVSLNQMLDEIYALCKSELEAKIRAEQEKLSQMM